MHRHHDVAAVGKAAAHPFDLVGKHVGRAVLHRGGQVQDDGATGAPRGNCRLAGLQRHFELGHAKHLGRILKHPFGFGLRIGEALDLADAAVDERNDFGHAHAEHHLAPYRCHGVVDMHDRASRTTQRFDGPGDEFFTRRRHDLNGHVVGNPAFVDELAQEVKLHLRRRRKADFDFLEADAHQQVKHAQLALQIHRLDQGLVAVTQVCGQPDGRLRQHCVGPGTVLQSDGRKCTVLAGWLGQHGHGSRWIKTSNA